jgi:hypothetical protein
VVVRLPQPAIHQHALETHTLGLDLQHRGLLLKDIP